MAPRDGPKPNSAGKSVLAGGIAGAIEATVMFPTEYIKTQLQLQNKSQPKYTGMFNCATVTVRENGIFGLYRGLSTLLIGSIPKSAVRFGGYEVLSSQLKDAEGKISAGNTFLCGLGAGVLEAIFAVTPMETMKTKMIHDQNAPLEQRKYRGLTHAVATVVRAEAIHKPRNKVSGCHCESDRDRFLVFHEIKKKYNDYYPNKEFGMMKSALAGAIAGGTSVLVNNPLDVVKTQMQGLDASKYKGSFDCARLLFRTHGPFFFYKGAVPRLIRVCGDAAIAFSVYGREEPLAITHHGKPKSNPNTVDVSAHLSSNLNVSHSQFTMTVPMAISYPYHTAFSWCKGNASSGGEWYGSRHNREEIKRDQGYDDNRSG
ncbi:hypothetical protein PROFUN_15126 [Planoprotostelium fungivorum]|uniref:Tricarboxylate transport protein, mitochondrial n=1 Tax=Planoprotostelium fungivorum TaxID=1890364 RepID=A0A2P6MZT9_9EUKA|nr:hypothetical protein PROFUN_15126 [Planoprotostelium fungivorum]